MKISIRRESAYADKLRNYKIILDDQVIGEIGDGQSRQFDVSEGNHCLYLKIDWARSNKVSFDTVGNQEAGFTCVSSLRGGAVLLAIIYAVFLHWKYIKLERIN